MFFKRFVTVMGATFLLGANAGANTLDIDDRPSPSAHSPQAGVALRAKGTPMRQASGMGVLHISLGDVDTAGGSSHSGDNADAVGLLRFDSVPLPAAAWLFGTVVLGIVAVSRRRPEQSQR